MVKSKSDTLPTAEPVASGTPELPIPDKEPVQEKEPVVLKPLRVRPWADREASYTQCEVGKPYAGHLIKRDASKDISAIIKELRIPEPMRLEVELVNGQVLGYDGPMAYELVPLNAGQEGAK